MAIKISGTDVINNSIDVVNARHGQYTGIVTASAFVGDGLNLTNINTLDGKVFYISARR